MASPRSWLEKTQGLFPTEGAAVVLLYSLVASGQIKLRKIDGHEGVRATMTKNLVLAAAA